MLVSRWGTDDLDADLNRDGAVDAVDLSILAASQNTSNAIISLRRTV